MIVCLLRTWGVWFLAVQLVKAEVTLENGAYRNIVVSFSSNLPSDERENILKNTKDLLDKTSSVLQKTLGVSIGQVTFALPDDWEVSGYDSGPIPRVEPDILVDNREGSPYGKGPFTEQYGGCGVRGTHIDVPYSFLTSEDTYPKEKLLAREWLKFRYGVFDEHGFPGDSKYPDHYTVPGDKENVKVTECTDPAVEYLIQNSNNETCSLGQENCTINIGDGAGEVKSSLMYLHEELINVDQVCGKEHQHNFMSPSKQNILCSERSIWDVLNEFDELKNTGPTVSADIDYQIVKFSKPKVLILLEATSTLKSKRPEITFALQRVLFDLPEGTHLGVKTFIPSLTKDARPFSQLEQDRSLMIGANFDAPSNDVCPLCVLENSLNVFPENETGLIVLITASRSDRENSALLEKLKKSHHFLLLITITDDGVSLDGYSDLLKELTQLNQAYLSDIKSSKIELFKALYTVIMSHFPFSHTDPSIEIVYNGTISIFGGIDIPNNQLTEEVTIWMDNGNYEPNQVLCTDQNGANVNLTEIEEILIARVTYKAEGPVNCTLMYGGPKMVQVTKPRPSGSEYFLSASTWVHDTTPNQPQATSWLQQADSKVQMPVIIYAKINYGSYPVSFANVEAVVKADDGAEETFLLKDDGKGDPDITMGDGIYSGYFFEFIKEGSYNVKVQIKTDASQAKAIKTGNDRCCGTQVEPKVPHGESTIQVPAFEKTVSTVFSAISSKPENGYPPAKILDLRVTKFEPPSLLELSWTAPGGEVDRGNATRYTLKSFTNRKDALENFESTGQELSISQNPSSSGTSEVLSLQLNEVLDDNMTHYLTLRAEGKTPGQPSNVVTVSVPEAGTPTEPPEPTEETKSSGPDSRTIAIIIGVLVGVIFICACLYLVIYCVGKRKERAKQERRKAEEGSAGAVRNGGGMGMNSIPADVILRHHSEVVKAKKDHKDPPIFKEEDAASEKSREDYSQVQRDHQPPELPTTQPPKSPKRITPV